MIRINRPKVLNSLSFGRRRDESLSGRQSSGLIASFYDTRESVILYKTMDGFQMSTFGWVRNGHGKVLLVLREMTILSLTLSVPPLTFLCWELSITLNSKRSSPISLIHIEYNGLEPRADGRDTWHNLARHPHSSSRVYESIRLHHEDGCNRPGRAISFPRSSYGLPEWFASCGHSIF